MVSTQRRWLLTGGIGSGKSEVRRLLAARGVRTVDADTVGHEVLAGEGFAPVAQRWPGVVFEGEISRQALAGIVFDDPGELAALEEITHRLIFGRIQTDLEGFSGVAVVEMPVLASEIGWPMIVVDAPDEMRVQRAVARGMDRAEVERRMKSQPSREEWLASADLVVPNHGDLISLENTVRLLAERLIAGS